MHTRPRTSSTSTSSAGRSPCASACTTPTRRGRPASRSTGAHRHRAPGLHVTIEHIGSTSVPGLAAKPIVDVAVSVPDVTDEAAYLEPLLAAGYVLRVREPGHRLVRTPERDAHVHVYEHGAREVDDYLLLRDHLRRDDADRQRYEDVKRGLMTRSWDDSNAYADAKTTVIDAIKERARTADHPS